MLSSLVLATALFYVNPATPADALPVSNDAWIISPVPLSPSDEEALEPDVFDSRGKLGGIGSDYVAGLRGSRQHANPIGTDGTTFVDRWGGLRFDETGIDFVRDPRDPKIVEEEARRELGELRLIENSSPYARAGLRGNLDGEAGDLPQKTITYWGPENPSGPLDLAQQLGIDQIGDPTDVLGKPKALVVHPGVQPADHPTTAEWRKSTEDTQTQAQRVRDCGVNDEDECVAARANSVPLPRPRPRDDETN
jgi:hypothetical protein